MSFNKKVYHIYFGEEKKKQKEELFEANKNEFLNEDIQIILEKIDFIDYNSTSTIGDLKLFFLTNFGEIYKCCKCKLFIYNKISTTFFQYKFQLLQGEDYTKISKYNYTELYIIKWNVQCKCEYDKDNVYINIHKFDLIEALKENKKLVKELEEFKNKYEKLEQENKILQKSEELNNFKSSKLENFYDIIIDINSIKSINNEGWKVKFNEKGLEKYKKHKEEELTIIGVIGNNNKGKSFILSKISKIKLLTGTSIQTEGLSIKYPELKEYKGRQLILLDSAGLQTPVLRKDNNEKEKLNEEKIINNKNEQKENENPLNKEKEIIIEFKENARDKIMTELFLQNFIIKLSDILLVVVGKLTYSEQLLINKIKYNSKRQNKTRIFIIHNLQEFRLVDQVKEYINNTLLKCSTFNLKKRTWITTKKDEEKESIEKNEKKSNDIKNENIKIDIENNQNEIKANENNNEEDIDKNIVGEIVNDISILNNIHFTEILYFGNNKKIDIFHLIMANHFLYYIWIINIRYLLIF